MRVSATNAPSNTCSNLIMLFRMVTKKWCNSVDNGEQVPFITEDDG